jgi:TolA-binding protein
MESAMPPANIIMRLILVLVLFFSLIFTGCSYLPWVAEDEDELAFEDDFPFEDEEVAERVKKDEGMDSDEDDFFSEDSELSDIDSEETFLDSEPDGFSSIDQRTDKGELKSDVESLQSQQEALISKVRELEEILSTLEPKINAASESLESSVASVADSSDFLEPEVEDLKAQVSRLNEEITRIKMQRLQSVPATKKRTRRVKAKTSPEYDKALRVYRKKNYDESILLFQNLSLSNPPSKLRDNIAFWIGVNYVALEMYDDAILQFETVLNKFPRGNKTHDSRYMLGLTYSKKGETSRAVEVLEGALKKSPPPEVRGKILAQLDQIQ